MFFVEFDTGIEWASIHVSMGLEWGVYKSVWGESMHSVEYNDTLTLCW